MLTEIKELEVINWGMLNYASASTRQQSLVEERLRGLTPDRLILVEHPPVVTIGQSGETSDLLLSEDVYRERGVEISRSERGGKVTYHGPGQMVAYPIIKLQNKDLHI